MNFNKAIVAGNITSDPELKKMTNGNSVVNFTVAVNRYYNDKEGNRKEETEFHNVVFFGRQAENIDKYMSKGSQILVEGRLKTRSWEDKEGKKHYRTEIIGETAQFGKRAEKVEEEEDDDIDLEEIPFD